MVDSFVASCGLQQMNFQFRCAILNWDDGNVALFNFISESEMNLMRAERNRSQDTVGLIFKVGFSDIIYLNFCYGIYCLIIYYHFYILLKFSYLNHDKSRNTLKSFVLLNEHALRLVVKCPALHKRMLTKCKQTIVFSFKLI